MRETRVAFGSSGGAHGAHMSNSVCRTGLSRAVIVAASSSCANDIGGAVAAYKGRNNKKHLIR